MQLLKQLPAVYLGNIGPTYQAGMGLTNYRLTMHLQISKILTSVAAPTNIGDNYGARLRGYVVPPLPERMYFILPAMIRPTYT